MRRRRRLAVERASIQRSANVERVVWRLWVGVRGQKVAAFPLVAAGWAGERVSVWIVDGHAPRLGETGGGFDIQPT